MIELVTLWAQFQAIVKKRDAVERVKLVDADPSMRVIVGACSVVFFRRCKPHHLSDAPGRVVLSRVYTSIANGKRTVQE